MAIPKFIPLADYQEYDVDEMRQRALSFCQQMRRRRTVRHFSSRPVPLEVIENCIRAAAAAPSGANLQPWHFVVITDPAIKTRIRYAAEQEEREFYEIRAPKEWLEALSALGTEEHKPLLEVAPFQIARVVER